MNRTAGTLIAACAIAATLTSTIPAHAGSGLICKAMTWGNAENTSKKISRIIALNRWRANAGPGWNNWSKARDRSHRCRKVGTIWQCVRKARPCRKLGLGSG